jgi:hypothetical protein
MRLTTSQLEGKLLRTLHARRNVSYAGIAYSSWPLDTIKVTRPGDPHHPGFVNLHITLRIMRRACFDGLQKASANE